MTGVGRISFYDILYHKIYKFIYFVDKMENYIE